MSSKRQSRQSMIGASNRRAPEPPVSPRKHAPLPNFGATVKSSSESKSSPPPKYNPFAEPGTKAPKVVSRHDDQTVHRHKAATLAGHHSGHSEIVQQVVRDFFMTRPVSVLLEVFRERDVDNSGTLDKDEFKALMRQINLNLSDKDADVLFRHSDVDGSGVLEFSEFFNKFRNELNQPLSSQKEPFFWHKARPRKLVERPARVKMEDELKGENMNSLSSDEMLQVIQDRVDQNSAMEVFQMFDENRNGRLDTKEFRNAMKHLHINATELQAEDLITKINAEQGSEMHKYLNYAPFVATFRAAGDLENTAGGLGGGERERASKTPSPVMKGSPVKTNVASGAPAAEAAALRLKHLDSVSLMSSQQTPRNEVRKTAPELDRLRPREKEWMQEQERARAGNAGDQLANWRGTDGNFGDGRKISLSGRELGRNIDWHAYKAELGASGMFDANAVHRIPKDSAETSAKGSRNYLDRVNALNGVGVSGSRSARGTSSAEGADEGAVRRGAMTDRPSLHTVQEAIATKTMREVMKPLPGSPAFVRESERLVRSAREQQFPLSVTIKEKERRDLQYRAESNATHARQLAGRLQDSLEARASREEALDQSRVRARTLYAERNKDLQLVHESKTELDIGLKQIVTEETPFPKVTSRAPPHLSSHWETISSHHNDPPPRQHTKLVVSYRRAYPDAERRPETPPGKAWGGIHDPSLLTPRSTTGPWRGYGQLSPRLA